VLRFTNRSRGSTVIALVLVDRVGRKPLLYVGISGMTAALLMLSSCFHQHAERGIVFEMDRIKDQLD